MLPALLALVSGVAVEAAAAQSAGPRIALAWQRVPGRALAQVAAGSPSTTWGVAQDGKAWRLEDATWKPVGLPPKPGRRRGRFGGGAQATVLLRDVAAGADGTVWAVTRASKVLRLENGTTWVAVPGSLQQVAVGGAKEVWGLDAGGQLFRSTGEGWRTQPGPKLQDLSVASDGTMWGVGKRGEVFRQPAGGKRWDRMPGELRQVAVGAAGLVAGIDGGGQVWRWTNRPASKGETLVAAKVGSCGADRRGYGILRTTGGDCRRLGGRKNGSPLANTLIHCGIAGTPTYGKVQGCRITSGPGCDTRALPGQCSFPRARARELCGNHGQCAGFTCNKGRGDCQARDAAEVRTLVPNRSFDSELGSAVGDADWTDCHLDWCVARPGRAGYTAAPVGACQKKVGYGALPAMRAGECRAMGGRMNGEPADGAWSMCHFDWCADENPHYTAARPGTCGRKAGYGAVTMTAGDCRRMGGRMNGNPPANRWTGCHLDWCDATAWARVPGVKGARSISLSAGGDLWVTDTRGAPARLSLLAYAAIAESAAEAGAAAARQVGRVRAQTLAAASRVGDAEAQRVAGEAETQIAQVAGALAGALGNLGLYSAARPGSCGGARRGYGFIHMIARDCRRMGGNMNGNPSDHEWTRCHLDWCVTQSGQGYTAQRVGKCGRQVGYGIVMMTAGDCRRIGGKMNVNHADPEWTQCHLSWCADPQPRIAAAAPGWCKTPVLGHGRFGTTAADCRTMFGSYEGLPADSDWTDCQFDWCAVPPETLPRDPFVRKVFDAAAAKLRATPVDRLSAVFQELLASAGSQVRAEWKRRAKVAKTAKIEEVRRQVVAQVAAQGLKLDPARARAAMVERIWNQARAKPAGGTGVAPGGRATPTP